MRDDRRAGKVSYYAPAARAARHHLSGDLESKLAGIVADGPA